MSKGGYNRVYRRILDHPTLKDPVEKWALVSLVLSAAWKDTEQRIPGTAEVIKVKRGQFMTTRRQLMELWGTGTTKTQNIIKLLILDQSITIEADRKKTLITLCNYDEYQSPLDEGQDTSAPTDQLLPKTQAGHKQATKERILRSLKKIKENNAGAREIANPCADLIDGVTWEVWQKTNMVEAGLVHTLEKQGWLSEGGEA